MNPLNTYEVPISIKGIVIIDGKVWLRKNERDFWEIPGGKLDKGEQPETTVVRELKEELGIETKVRDILQAHLFRVEDSIDESHGVLVVTYACDYIRTVGELEIESEGGEVSFGKFTQQEVETLNIPTFYKKALEKAFQRYL